MAINYLSKIAKYCGLPIATACVGALMSTSPVTAAAPPIQPPDDESAQVYSNLSPQQKEVARQVAADLKNSASGGTAKAYVGVPPEYVYAPDNGSNLNDYCSNSPDSWAKADFRGPCAIHDMCYEKPGDNSAQCDAELRRNMEANCDVAYVRGTAGSQNCMTVVGIYYAAVTSFADDP